MFVTIAERRRREAARRIEAARLAIESLSENARRLDGIYILYGSAARGEMGDESDIDVLLDFPSANEAEAWRAAEDVCAGLGLPLDIMPVSWTDPKFVARVMAEGKILS